MAWDRDPAWDVAWDSPGPVRGGWGDEDDRHRQTVILPAAKQAFADYLLISKTVVLAVHPLPRRVLLRYPGINCFTLKAAKAA